MQQDSSGSWRSDDGRFVWNGDGWVPQPAATPNAGPAGPGAGVATAPAVPQQQAAAGFGGNAAANRPAGNEPVPPPAAAFAQVPLSAEQVQRLISQAECNLAKEAAMWALAVYVLVARLAGAIWIVFGLIVLVWGVLALPVLFLIGLVVSHRQKQAARSDVQGGFAERLPVLEAKARALNPPVYRIRTARGPLNTSKQENLLLATAAQRYRADLQGACVDVTPRTRAVLAVTDPDGRPLA